MEYYTDDEIEKDTDVDNDLGAISIAVEPEIVKFDVDVEPEFLDVNDELEDIKEEEQETRIDPLQDFRRIDSDTEVNLEKSEDEVCLDSEKLVEIVYTPRRVHLKYKSKSDPAAKTSVTHSQVTNCVRPAQRNFPDKNLWTEVQPPEKQEDLQSNFSVWNTGPRNCPNSRNPSQYFDLFFTDDIWKMMVIETNRYAVKKVGEQRAAGTQLSKWINVSVEEMKKFWALLINMGLTKREHFSHYWDSCESQQISFYPKTMPIKRFQDLLSMFHVSNSLPLPKNNPEYDAWAKIRHFITVMNAAFKKFYVPTQKVYIEESVVGKKNDCTFIHYNPKKEYVPYGVKKFDLCDSSSGYVLQTSMYLGRDLSEGPNLFNHKVVSDLVKQSDLLGKGYHMCAGNVQIQVPLAKWLLTNSTFLTGTASKSHELPKEFFKRDLITDGPLYYRKGPILYVAYREQKSSPPVYLITTGCHAENHEFLNKFGKHCVEPLMVHHLKKYLGKDSDKRMYHITCTRPTRKYWRKIVYSFVDTALNNAYILYQNENGNPMSRRIFMVRLVDHLAGLQEPLQTVGPVPVFSGVLQHNLIKLKKGIIRTCSICAKEGSQSQTSYWCPGCNVGVHTFCYYRLNHDSNIKLLSQKRKKPIDSSSDSN